MASIPFSKNPFVTGKNKNKRSSKSLCNLIDTLNPTRNVWNNLFDKVKVLYLLTYFCGHYLPLFPLKEENWNRKPYDKWTLTEMDSNILCHLDFFLPFYSLYSTWNNFYNFKIRHDIFLMRCPLLLMGQRTAPVLLSSSIFHFVEGADFSVLFTQQCLFLPQLLITFLIIGDWETGCTWFSICYRGHKILWHYIQIWRWHAACSKWIESTYQTRRDSCLSGAFWRRKVNTHKTAASSLQSPKRWVICKTGIDLQLAITNKVVMCSPISIQFPLDWTHASRKQTGPCLSIHAQ